MALPQQHFTSGKMLTSSLAGAPAKMARAMSFASPCTAVLSWSLPDRQARKQRHRSRGYSRVSGCKWIVWLLGFSQLPHCVWAAPKPALALLDELQDAVKMLPEPILVGSATGRHSSHREQFRAMHRLSEARSDCLCQTVPGG